MAKITISDYEDHVSINQQMVETLCTHSKPSVTYTPALYVYLHILITHCNKLSTTIVMYTHTRFSTNKSLHLLNNRRYAHSYNGRLIGNRVRFSISTYSDDTEQP